MARKSMPEAVAGVRLPKLPPEIWHMVCSYLDTADVPSFRQTCQDFAHLGQPFALPEIVLYLHQSDFKNLCVVADHPVKSKYVRSLIFIPHTLPDPKLTFDQFVRKYHHREKINMFTNTASRYGGHSTRPFNRRQLREYYAAYEYALRQQTEILQQPGWATIDSLADKSIFNIRQLFADRSTNIRQCGSEPPQSA